ncbi:Uncharacterized membrane protein YhhN [Marininema mesophilum]|uniref:Uncharacterized membrane protein YhhN n=1 Tax=Marininema mesophilum TaxID=1048340 RepID=A0A1H3CLK3_9BACL|nr:lysoplasmalogenase [Marininema mesophilum]SDX55043.1 Uncharacterized membrane protein YhhN [Marininema mesophilum]
MHLSITIAIIFSAIGYFYSLFKEITWGKYIFKPGTIFFILLLVLLNLDQVGVYGWLLCFGLLFSMLGDIFLMLPSDRFIQGLISFFIAHVIYVIAFPGGNGIFRLDALFIALLLILFAAIYLRLIASSVKTAGGTSLLFAVLAYITVISLMVYKAFLSGELLLIVGASSFYISDAILAWNRFVKQYPRGQFAVMVTYYLAQLLIAYSVIL